MPTGHYTRTHMDLSGQSFGRLVVVSYAGSKNKKTRWLCRCECGAEKVIGTSELRNGNTRSCGKHREGLTSTHGKAGTRIYQRWQNMLNRCYNPKIRSYADYGKRGIKVCDRWRHSFENFIADMGEPPSPELTIERVDTDGDYCPENCIWDTRTAQARNQRRNTPITVGDRSLTAGEWAEISGIKYHTIYARHFILGWDARKSVFEPLYHRA